MTERTTSYPVRPWIAAEASFAAQPAVLAGLADAIGGAVARVPDRPGRVLLVGIGASHAAAASAVHRMRSIGIDATRHLPGELAGHLDADLIFATSQSGRSAEVVDLVAGVGGGRVVAVTNYQPSPLGDLAGHAVNLGDHADSSVSFLSYTSTLAAFGMIADHWEGTYDSARWARLLATALDGAAAAEPSLRTAAEIVAEAPFVDVVAPAALLSAAEEAALMFREGPLVAATGMETRLYLHGPMDVAGEGAHIVIGGAREALLVEQLAERASRLIFLRTDPSVSAPSAVVTIDVRSQDPMAAAIESTIMMQFLNLRVADAKGIEIDRPVFTRLDTKTPTVTR